MSTESRTCEHANRASAEQLSSYELAAQLSAISNSSIPDRTKIELECEVCGNSACVFCCLECDFVGCVRHACSKHALGALIGQNVECAVFCFKCRDVQFSQKFELIRQKAVHGVLKRSGSAGSNNETSNGLGNGPGDVNEAAAVEDKDKDVVQSFTAFTGLRGFVNLGSTCYASVVLQSLVHNPLTKSFFLAGGHRRETCQASSCLMCSVDKIYTEFYGTNGVTGYGATDMLVALSEKQPVMGAGSTEQDAHEFYLMLLSEFHKTHIPSPMFAKSDNPDLCGCITHRHFSGTLCSSLNCTCGAVTSKEEPMIDLGLDVGQLPETTLNECLNRFTAGELLTNYTCDRCSQTKSTTKKLLLQSLPLVLMIQLKRFKMFASGGSSKIECPVNFELEIDMAPYVLNSNSSEPLIYELFGVICHTGSLDTGHYTCVMKHATGVWYHFDDSMVRRVDTDFVKQTRTAYLLLYVVKSAM